MAKAILVGRAVTSQALSGDTMYCVSTAGSDTTGDGTASHPYKTIAKAISMLSKNINGYNAVINVLAGTYGETVSVSGFMGGCVTLYLSGDVTVSGISVNGCSLIIDGRSPSTLTTTYLSAIYDANIHTTYNVATTIVNGGGYSSTGINGGIIAEEGSNISIYAATVVNNTNGYAVFARATSIIYVSTISGSGNAGGLYASSGGRIASAGYAGLSCSNGLEKTSSGGIIGNGASGDDQAIQITDYVRTPGYAVDTGAANAYVASLSPAPTSLPDGFGLVLKISHTNTGASTVNLNNLGVHSIKTYLGNDPPAGVLMAGSIYSMRYNSTSGNFILLSDGGNVANTRYGNKVGQISTFELFMNGFSPYYGRE